jgi:hypothetical protein
MAFVAKFAAADCAAVLPAAIVSYGGAGTSVAAIADFPMDVGQRCPMGGAAGDVSALPAGGSGRSPEPELPAPVHQLLLLVAGGIITFAVLLWR